MIKTQHKQFMYLLMTHMIQTILPSLNSTINAQAMGQIPHTHHITPALQYRTKISQKAMVSPHPLNMLQYYQYQKTKQTVTF